VWFGHGGRVDFADLDRASEVSTVGVEVDRAVLDVVVCDVRDVGGWSSLVSPALGVGTLAVVTAVVFEQLVAGGTRLATGRTGEAHAHTSAVLGRSTRRETGSQ
jgi:hypothetical protein